MLSFTTDKGPRSGASPRLCRNASGLAKTCGDLGPRASAWGAVRPAGWPPRESWVQQVPGESPAVADAWRYTRGMQAPSGFPSLRRASGSLLGCLLLGLSACAAPRLNLAAEAEPPGTSFNAAYERWTRDASIVSFRSMDTTFLISATLRSKAFQRTYADRYCSLYGVNDPGERARIETAEQAVADGGVAFWVQTYAHNDRWNDLAPKHSRWRLLLIDELGGEVGPPEISLVGSEGVVELSLFNRPPDPLRKIWHVKFPSLRQVPTASPRKLTLRLTGPEGQTDLVWQVE